MGEKEHNNILAHIKILPRSSINQVVGKEAGVWKIKLTAPPMDGKANKELINFLAKRLKIAKGRIKIISGQRSRLKKIEIKDFSFPELERMLDGLK